MNTGPTARLPETKPSSDGVRNWIWQWIGGRMRGGGGSVPAVAFPWWREDEDVGMEALKIAPAEKGKAAEEVDMKEKAVVVVEEETGWRCWKHPMQSPGGVCASCLRDRLLRLCPNCAGLRPCSCFASPSSSRSSSSGSPRSCRWISGDEAGLGPVGTVSRLIASEPAFRRSRSVGIPLVRSRSVAAAPAACDDPSPSSTERGGRRGWAFFWPFSRSAGEGKKVIPPLGLFRSRTVAAGRSSMSGGGVREEEAKRKSGRRWHFPSPMKVFRQRKQAAKTAGHGRSPMWHG
ncbi:uncharacterized protein LOC122025765 [Zingiber officinale]|uniref:uncharacterized protein LOC122025765 n=1 Tax=Zingiber officinale TaxID=94328 RepID=UPI001C4C8811|nr:uncharacterized protein LOC122025765 [Zingiber officinale]